MRKEKEKTKKQKDKKKGIGITLLILLLCVLLLVIGGIACVAGYFLKDLEIDRSLEKKTPEDLGINTSFYNEIDKNQNYDITNIALFGLDTRANDYTGRSDTIIILSIDKDRNKIKLTSIARDTYVTVPGYGETKLNHAYAYGGPELAIYTLNETFQLNIQDYVTVNFGDMANIVDMVGGVRVDLSEAERNVTGSLKNLPVGNVTLNGEQAVDYCRIRYIDSDSVRTSRQREVLTSLFQSARGIRLSQYPKFIKSGLNMCTTSLGYTELLNLSQIMLEDDLALELASLPNDQLDYRGVTINGTWYYQYDTVAAGQMLHEFIYEDVPFEAQS